MARIIVLPDMQRRPSIDAPVLMDEEVKPDHLADDHASRQIIERVAWAVLDAETVDAVLDAETVEAVLDGQTVEVPGRCN